MHINTSAPTLRNEPQSDAGANAAAWYCVRAQPQTVRHTLVVVWKETVPAGCQGVAAARSVLAGTERIVFAVAVLLAVAVAVAVSILPVAIGSIVDSGSDHVAWVTSLETLAACSTCGTDGAAAASAEAIAQPGRTTEPPALGPKWGRAPELDPRSRRRQSSP